MVIVMLERGAPIQAAPKRVAATRAASSELRRRASILPTLNYYLTFIRYFGFSINPSESSASMLGSRSDARWLRLAGLLLSLVGALVKLIAIAFTSFIAANHCVVLVDYILNDSRPLVDLMLEVRLASTKLSALIFVLSWHWNQNHVRHLISLVKSTSIYVSSSPGALGFVGALTNGPTKPAPVCQQEPLMPAASSTGALLEAHSHPEGCTDADAAELWPSQAGRAPASRQMLAKLDSSILRWWLMCICVTMLHFSVSEAELLRSYHLWQWLDDYSMHTMSNATISQSTLMFLVSLDNYVYTVHVYGTRLVGASIICIVCSLQSASIGALELQVRQLIRASPASSGQRQASLCSWWYAKLGVAAGCHERDPMGLRQVGARERADARPQSGSRARLFILGERDWFLTGAANEQRPAELPCTRLVGRARRRVQASPLGRWLRDLRNLAAQHYSRSRCSSVASAARLVDDERPVVTATGERSPSTCQHVREPNVPRQAHTPTGSRYQPVDSAVLIERHLERLASRYELVRQVSARIDACFGPMLFIQYSFLFFMSCIDVVYFSISFNPNTKTKCIIVSGMILLWWPYLLLYKFSSDIGSRSKELLTSVRRLARLSLLEQHSLDKPSSTWLRPRCRLADDRSLGATSTLRRSPQPPPSQANLSWQPETRPTILNKLDHVFKPTYLTLLGIMKVNKFFLLNFAKIVITASVMMIQFISN